MKSAVNDFLDDCRGGRMAEAPIVKVEQGELQGKVVPSPSGKSFYSFQGIPYAKAPLGSLRFKAPQPAEHWEGVRDATEEGNVSAQIDPLVYKEFIGDENCLFLNVYTPNLDGEFLPVMLFIHGGGFKFGSGNSRFYGADYLVEKDVVLVTINYRCGPLGFLCLNTPEVPGNAGLKDMIQAIQWVKENIGQFGGNSGNVTVFGESCGGVATSLLTSSPLSKDLINKAIIQSGTALNNWAFQTNPLDNARNLAKELGSDAEEIDEILDFLSAVSVRDIVDAGVKLCPPELFYEKAQNVFAPVIEKEFYGVEAALNESFTDILTSGRTSNIPIMIGSTTLEFAHGTCNDDLRVFIPENLNIDRNSDEAIQIADKIKELYFKSGNSGVENLDEYYQLLSDKLVNIDVHRYVSYLVKVARKPVYYYKFDYVGELNISKKLLDGLGLKKATHMDELGYIFKNGFQDDVEPTSDDLTMRERMLRLWTNFAKSGNPTPEESTCINITWLPVTKDNHYYLNLSNELSLETNPDNEKMIFWEDLYHKYYKNWEKPQSNECVQKSEPVLEQQLVNTSEIIEDTVPETLKTVEETPVNEEIQPQREEIQPQCEEIKAQCAENKPESEEIKPQCEESKPICEESKPICEEIQPQPEQNNTEHINPVNNITDVVDKVDVIENVEEIKEAIQEEKPNIVETEIKEVIQVNGTGEKKSSRTSNEIKMVSQSNGNPKDVIRANDPPEDDLPKNIGVNKFVNFFESLGGKK